MWIKMLHQFYNVTDLGIAGGGGGGGRRGEYIVGDEQSKQSKSKNLYFMTDCELVDYVTLS